MKQLADILFKASFFYVLVRFLIWIGFMLNRTLGDSMNYHYSSDFLWYVLMFILPIIVSTLMAVILKSKYLKQAGMLLFPVLVIGTLCLGYINNNQWGYWFKRPATFNELETAKKIVSISDITKDDDQEYFKIESDTNVTPELYGIKDVYYGNFKRPLMVFQDNASKHPDLDNWYEITMDPNTKINRSDLKSITTSILKSNILIPPSSDSYKKRAHSFNGKVIEFKTSENNSFYHVALKSGEISNDHYAFYEFLIETNPPHKILKHQTFFIDIAGIEGVEYANVFGLLEFLSLFTICIVVVLFNGTKKLINKKDAKKRRLDG